MSFSTYLVLRASVSTARQQYIRYWVESEADWSRGDWARAIMKLNDAEIELKKEVED